MKFSIIKIRPILLVISLGLVVAVIICVLNGYEETAKYLALAIVGVATKLIESEEASSE